ncbi:MAG: alanine racemase [Clostridiales bacterium]|nr:alanine racemase [Clostridiales bacterium]
MKDKISEMKEVEFDRSCVLIDLDAVRFNYRQIKALTKDSTDMFCVVKADAYGHGAVKLAKVLEEEGAAGFCLATVDEAKDLALSGITRPLMILGFTSPDRFPDIVKYGIGQAVYTMEDARLLSEEAVKQGKDCKIHIKIDTGMGRIGFKTDGSADDEIVEIFKLPGLVPEGIFSHFAVSDTGDDEYTNKQFGIYKDMVERLENKGVKFTRHHICNSAGIMRFPEMHLDTVRAGLILYGMYPEGCPDRDKMPDLKPVMTWLAKVIFVKDIPEGATVSYGRHFTADKKTRVATVGIGYADGFSRRLSNGFMLNIKGQKYPIIGNVCMDMCMADVTGSDIKRGDIVEIFGEGNPSDNLSSYIGTINYEITCDVGKRVKRLYLEDGKLL